MPSANDTWLRKVRSAPLGQAQIEDLLEKAGDAAIYLDYLNEALDEAGLGSGPFVDAAALVVDLQEVLEGKKGGGKRG